MVLGLFFWNQEYLECGSDKFIIITRESTIPLQYNSSHNNIHRICNSNSQTSMSQFPATSFCEIF